MKRPADTAVMPSNPVDPAPSSALSSSSPGLIAAIAAALLFYCSATVFGVLEVHSSTDTWIGLAAARQISELGHVPQNDTFSITLQNHPWYNQNWLTHVGMYFLYSHFGPDAVAIGTWCVSGSIFLMTLFAARFRSGSWLAAIIAGAFVGVGGRDFLSARPSTTGFFCIAALAFLIAAIEGQKERPRWWPIVLLYPLLVMWGDAHGSFVFAYGILALYLTCWAAKNFLRFGWVAARPAQAYAIAGVAAVGLLTTLLTGPFGLANFIHPGKVAGSDLWRGVSEWNPPYTNISTFPPMQRYWFILAGVAVLLIVVGVLAIYTLEESVDSRKKKQPERSGVNFRFFDLFVILIGLGFSFWARRFAPMFYIFAAPIFARWVMLVVDRVRAAKLLTAEKQETLRWSVASGCLVLAVLVGISAARSARAELIDPYESAPQTGLLDRVTVYHAIPDDCVQYIARNELKCNLFTEWTLAGIVMFKAPIAKVMIDGRAQQVYDEQTYLDYQFLSSRALPAEDLRALLEKYRINCVLIRMVNQGSSDGRNFFLSEFLQQSPDWTILMYRQMGPAVYAMFLRKSDPLTEQVTRRIVEAKEWRPETGLAWAARAQFLVAAQPPQLDLALESMMKALALEPRLGLGESGYKWVVAQLVRRGRAAEAQQYVQSELNRLQNEAANLDPRLRAELLRSLAETRRLVPGAASAP